MLVHFIGLMLVVLVLLHHLLLAKVESLLMNLAVLILVLAFFNFNFLLLSFALVFHHLLLFLSHVVFLSAKRLDSTARHILSGVRTTNLSAGVSV